MRGQSVLLCDPFYRDLTGMFLLPIQHQLLNHRKVLVLSGRCAGDEDVLLWLRQGLLEATGLPELWKADFLPAAPSPHREELPDVGVLRFHDLYNLELQQANQAFFEDVALVILLETSNLLGASAALLLNAVKVLGNIPHDIHLIAPSAIEPIQKLKVDYLKSKNPRLHTDEVLIALSASAADRQEARLALSQLPKLEGCQAHTSVMLSDVDIKIFKKLGVQLTCEAVYEHSYLSH